MKIASVLRVVQMWDQGHSTQSVVRSADTIRMMIWITKLLRKDPDGCNCRPHDTDARALGHDCWARVHGARTTVGFGSDAVAHSYYSASREACGRRHSCCARTLDSRVTRCREVDTKPFRHNRRRVVGAVLLIFPRGEQHARKAKNQNAPAGGCGGKASKEYRGRYAPRQET